MKLITLIERLNQLGVKQISKSTIKRWAFDEKIIAMPVDKHGNKYKGGRERATDWPDEALEEAAAVWAVRYINSDVKHNNKRTRITAEMIGVIKRAAAMLNDRPFAIYTLPPITGPLSTQHIALETIVMKFVSEDFDGLELFPGQTPQEKAECLNELVVAWIAAVEKVRKWKSNGRRACLMSNHPDLAKKLPPFMIDFSQIDPWREEVPCPWRIDKHARVTIFWFSWPSKNKTSREFWRPLFPGGITLSESDHNEIILYENYMDTRGFFKIDVGDREEAVRTEREKIAREINENFRKLQSLGFDPYLEPGSTFAAMEEKPFEKLTASEKQALKAFWNAFDLGNRDALVGLWSDDRKAQRFIQSIKKAKAVTQYLLQKEALRS